MSTEKLFQDFEALSAEDWKSEIEKSLKGADYQKSMVWQSPEGLTIQPFYTKIDLENLSNYPSLPAVFPYTRGIKTKENDWVIVEQLQTSNPKTANKRVLNALMNGATGISFSGEIKDEETVETLLNEILPQHIHLYFKNAGLNLPSFLESWAEKAQTKTRHFKGSLGFDPITKHTQFADFQPESELQQLSDTFADFHKKFPALQLIQISGSFYHNCGANLIQELAIALSIGNEYLHHAKKEKLDIDNWCANLSVSLSAGSNYFFEVAKLRAFRMLWANLAHQYQPKHTCSTVANIQSITSERNQSALDPYNNLLRATTASMAAILGGTGALTVLPHDSSYAPENDFSLRIARNIQLLILHESYFEKQIDPAAGSYYLESLTDQIAQETWKQFQEIESFGGFSAAFKQGKIHDLLNSSRAKTFSDLSSRKSILVGVNQFVDLNESLPESIINVEEYPEMLPKDAPLSPIRNSQIFEQLRAIIQKSKKIPQVFLLPIGDLAMRNARAMFCTNFFGVAGYKIISQTAFESMEEAINQLQKTEADIVVLCSSDAEYPNLSKQFHTLYSGDAIRIIAGTSGENSSQLAQNGFQDYVNLKSNLLETFNKINAKLGIA